MFSPENTEISVIIAVFNRSSVIQRAIKSFIQQDYLYKELIVIDGGSTDGTTGIIESLDSHISYWISEKDRGIYHAFNKGLEHASGNWIYFLGSDDYFHDSSSLSKASSYLSKIDHIKHKIVYGKVNLVSSKGTILEEINKPWTQIKDKFLQGCYICHQGVFQHRSLFESHGKFDESFKISGVYDLLLRELKHKNAFFMADVSVASMQVGGLSSNPEYSLKVMREYSKARKKNDIYNFAPLLYLGYIKTLIRIIFNKFLGEHITLLVVDFFRKTTGRALLWRKIRIDSK